MSAAQWRAEGALPETHRDDVRGAPKEHRGLRRPAEEGLPETLRDDVRAVGADEGASSVGVCFTRRVAYEEP